MQETEGTPVEETQTQEAEPQVEETAPAQETLRISLRRRRSTPDHLRAPLRDQNDIQSTLHTLPLF